MSKNNKRKESHEGESHKLMGFIQLGLVIVFIATSFFVSKALNGNKRALTSRSAETRSIFAETKDIAPDVFQISFKTTGIVQARAEVSVVPQVSGRIVMVNDAFFSGGQFEKDEVLFEIEPIDYELEVQRLESVVAQARTQFNLEEAEAAVANAEWKQINGDKPVPYLVARKPQKAEAWANLKAAKAQLENAKLALKRTKFSLPFAGHVLSSDLEKGQFVSANQSYGRVYDAASLEVQSSLEDKQLNWLLDSKDPDVKIQLTNRGETKEYNSVLKRGVSSLNPQTRFASVSFGFKDIPETLVPGVFVELAVQGPKLDQVLAVPLSALQKGDIVWAVDEQAKLYEIKGETVFANEDYVVLRGVDKAARIVTSKMPGAIAGMEIKTAEEYKDGGQNE